VLFRGSNVLLLLLLKCAIFSVLFHHHHFHHSSLIHFLLQAQNPPFPQFLPSTDSLLNFRFLELIDFLSLLLFVFV